MDPGGISMALITTFPGCMSFPRREGGEKEEGMERREREELAERLRTEQWHALSSVLQGGLGYEC